MKAKSYKPALVLLLNLVTPLIDKLFIPMETTTALWVFCIGIVLTIAILTLLYIISSEKESEKKKEIEKAILLILSKDRILFDEYMSKLKERKHLFSNRDWDFFEELKEIDRINKLPLITK